MKNAITLITENFKTHPEFKYYISIMKIAEENLLDQPDICIETCKSLIEGISKSIIERFGKNINREDFKTSKISPLTKQAFKLLREHKEYDDVVGIDLARVSVHLATLIAKIRDDRGDISHGKPVPKHEKSNEYLAYLSYQITESIISCMLDSFFRISKQLKDDATSNFEKVEYDENEDFNNLLDTDIPWDGKLLYSKALYELYYEDYLIKLNDYKDSNEEEENESDSN